MYFIACFREIFSTTGQKEVVCPNHPPFRPWRSTFSNLAHRRCVARQSTIAPSRLRVACNNWAWGKKTGGLINLQELVSGPDYTQTWVI